MSIPLRRARFVAPLLLAGAAVLTAPAFLAPSQAAVPLSASARPAPPAGGGTLSGLTKARAGEHCAGAFALRASDRARTPYCSHGPDPATEVYAEARGGGGGGGSKKPAPSPSPTASAAPSPSPSPSSGFTSSARCGTDGPRVQALFVRAADVPDRFPTLLPSLQQWLTKVDDVFAKSAAATGGVRRVRFLTDSSCTPVISNVTVPTTGDDDISSTISALQSLGYNRTDRVYLLWVDANVYCGIGTVKSDDTAAATNRNNSGPSYGRTDAGCWGGHTEAHELMHNLGGVQLSAPNSNGSWHCTDEYDLMCYQENSKPMTYPCGLELEYLFDCRQDDYFSTAPPAGSYLATHWNTASSAFLTSS